MASTGAVLSGKFHVYWNGTRLEHVGDCTLPDTIENDEVELVSDWATRKEIVPKAGYDNPDVDVLFDPSVYQMLLADKLSGSAGVLKYEASQTDGGSLSASYDAKVLTVGGGSGDVEGVMESFTTTFSIIGLNTAGYNGSLGTQAYE